jgi:hypothetical protein
VEEEKIRKLLDSLQQRFKAGEISEPTFLRLKEKYEKKSSTATPRAIDSPSSTPEVKSSALLDFAMKSVLTRAYVCDNCGAAIQVREGHATARCNYCGVVNAVDFLEHISERFREEKRKMLRGVISCLVSSSMVNLKISAFEKFKTIALPYENRAIENESKAWPQVQSHSRALSWVKDHCLEASKHRHYAAELYQNASEFASKPEDKMDALTNYYFNEGLGFLDSSLAFLWIVEQESSLICKRRMATSSVAAVTNFIEAFKLSHKIPFSNYAVLSKMLAYKGAEFWLRDHDIQEMIGLALYLKTSSRGQVWDTQETMHMAMDLASNLLDEKSGG